MTAAAPMPAARVLRRVPRSPATLRAARIREYPDGTVLLYDFADRRLVSECYYPAGRLDRPVAIPRELNRTRLGRTPRRASGGGCKPCFRRARARAESGGGVAWTNLANIDEDDESYATCVLTDATPTSKDVAVTDFGFDAGPDAIPASGATIDGVGVYVNAGSGTTYEGLATYDNVQLVVAGSPVGDDKSANHASEQCPARDTTSNPVAQGLYDLFGDRNPATGHHDTSTWGATLTAANVRASTFGATFRFTKAVGDDETVSVDAVYVIVWWHSVHQAVITLHEGSGMAPAYIWADAVASTVATGEGYEKHLAHWILVGPAGASMTVVDRRLGALNGTTRDCYRELYALSIALRCPVAGTYTLVLEWISPTGAVNVATQSFTVAASTRDPIYVSIDTGDAAGPGTLAEPYESLAAAIADGHDTDIEFRLFDDEEFLGALGWSGTTDNCLVTRANNGTIPAVVGPIANGVALAISNATDLSFEFLNYQTDAVDSEGVVFHVGGGALNEGVAVWGGAVTDCFTFMDCDPGPDPMGYVFVGGLDIETAWYICYIGPGVHHFVALGNLSETVGAQTVAGHYRLESHPDGVVGGCSYAHSILFCHGFTVSPSTNGRALVRLNSSYSSLFGCRTTGGVNITLNNDVGGTSNKHPTYLHQVVACCFSKPPEEIQAPATFFTACVIGPADAGEYHVPGSLTSRTPNMVAASFVHCLLCLHTDDPWQLATVLTPEERNRTGILRFTQCAWTTQNTPPGNNFTYVSRGSIGTPGDPTSNLFVFIRNGYGYAGTGNRFLLWDGDSEEGFTMANWLASALNTDDFQEDSLVTDFPAADNWRADAGLTGHRAGGVPVDGALIGYDLRRLSQDVEECPVGCTGLGPSAPTNLAATNGAGQNTLAWTAAAGEGAKTYTVYRSTGRFTGYASIAAEVAGTSYADTTATPGQEYWYRVACVTEHGESWPSVEDNATAVAGVASVPIIARSRAAERMRARR